MSVLIKANKIQVGQLVSLPPKEVYRIDKTSNIVTIWFNINEEKVGYIGYHPHSFLEVHDPEGEAPEMPTREEVLDRLLALIEQAAPDLHQLSGQELTSAIAGHLYLSGVVDIEALIELTNDLGPFEATPVRKCRVCGCTDDDCSQCIEASGEPCWWVEENLCSRCEDEGTETMNDDPGSDCDDPCQSYPGCGCIFAEIQNKAS